MDFCINLLLNHFIFVNTSKVDTDQGCQKVGNHLFVVVISDDNSCSLHLQFERGIKLQCIRHANPIRGAFFVSFYLCKSLLGNWPNYSVHRCQTHLTTCDNWFVSYPSRKFYASINALHYKFLQTVWNVSNAFISKKLQMQYRMSGSARNYAVFLISLIFFRLRKFDLLLFVCFASARERILFISASCKCFNNIYIRV